MEIDPNYQGRLAEGKVLAAALRADVPVARPFHDCRYDFIFDLGPRLLRIQCKTARQRGEVVVVSAETNRRAPEGFRRTTYTSEEIDGVAAYCPELDRCYFIPIAILERSPSIHLRLTPPRNHQVMGIRWAREYEFERVDWAELARQPGAVAQSEERLLGMQEVVGSNPISSTPLDLSQGSVSDSGDRVEVGMEAFHSRLSHYVRFAAVGGEVTVTYRGRPVASVVGLGNPGPTRAGARQLRLKAA